MMDDGPPPAKLPRITKTIDDNTSQNVVLDEEDMEKEDTTGTLEEPLATSTTDPLLPEGWVVIRHISGGTVYLHRSSRVCTWSKPYVVSTSYTIKKHRVPFQCIPCLEKWLLQDNRSPLAEQWHKDLDKKSIGLPSKLEPSKLTEYLKLRWPNIDDETQLVGSSNHSSENKEKVKRKKKPKSDSNKVIVPEALSKVINVNVPKEYRKPDAEGKISPAVWTVSLRQKPAVSLLLEFCQHYLRNEVNYIIKETTCSQSPYMCTAVIGGVQYASKNAMSKRAAKQAAAEATLDLFLPGVFTNYNKSSSSLISAEELEYLSSISIDDTQSTMLLSQSGLPLPWQILRECCRRLKGNGVGEPDFHIELRSLASGSSGTTSELDTTFSSSSSSCNVSTELQPSSGKAGVQSYYKLTCGPDLEVTGPCTGRKDGQQLAAQAMLKLLHPHIHTWDGLLKLYADTHSKLPRLITERQCADLIQTHSSYENEELLKQLREEMRKLIPSESKINE